MKARIALTLLAGCAVLAVAVSYQAYRDRRQPDDPDWLLQQADEQAWLNDWMSAAPVFHKAELLYQQRNEQAKALYAHVSRMMATSEMSGFAPQIALLTDDLQLPAARDPETRLRILTIRGMLETNYDAGLALKTWTEVGELARRQHHYMLASRALGEEGIAAFLLGDINGAQEKVMKAYLIAKYFGDPAARVRYASVYGAGLVELKKYDRALKPLDEAIRVANTTKGVAYPTIAIDAKIEALGGLGRYQEALSLTNEALARVTARHLSMHISELLRIRAGIYERTGQTKLAIDNYQAAIDIDDKVSDWRGLSQAGGSLATLYEQQDRLEDALHAIDDAINANKQIPDELYFLPRNLSIKARILARLGKTGESNTLYEKSADLIDSLLAHVPTPTVERELLTSMEQGKAYAEIEKDIREAVKKNRGNRSLMSLMMHRLLLYPDHPFGIGEIWGKRFNPHLGCLEPFLVTTAPDLSEDFVYAKERRLIEDIRGELRRGRRCQVYATFTGEHDVAARLERVLRQAGLRIAVLRPIVPTLKRELWYERQLKDGVEVVICHPKLVETGLDLLAFPTLYFYETGYSLHTLRQASRRSWRIGQKHPVQVKFLVSKATTQTTCLRLMGKKMLVALMMEGKFSGEGIHSLESDEDMMSAMARELVERGRVGESADAVWADLRRERAQHLPSMPVVSQSAPVEEDDPSLPLLSQEPVATSLPVPHLVESTPKRQQKPSALWPTGYAEGEQMLLFA